MIVLHSEKSIRLPASYWCYQPPDDSPPVGPAPPPLQNGCITFGCLKQLICKITNPTVGRLERDFCARFPIPRLIVP